MNSLAPGRLWIGGAVVLGVISLATVLTWPADAIGAPPPPPPPPSPPATGQRPTPMPAPTPATLGKVLFFDATLSNPVGQSCASCHSPDTGFTYPDSDENLHAGPVEGAVLGRFGNRKPPTVAYAAFVPVGPKPTPVGNSGQPIFVGGLFWDGRAPDLPTQAGMPFVNPNEMNDIVHNVASPDLVVQKALAGHSSLFVQVYGPQVLAASSSDLFQLICNSIAEYERSPEVVPFKSKYDAVVAGAASFTASELNGARLFSGSTTGRPGGAPHVKSAQCAVCHGMQPGPGARHDLFTNSGFFNTGVPKNPNNPFYTETDSVNNPLGYNPAGANFIDLGLGGVLYAKLGLSTNQDTLRVNGTFRTPTLRNVDKRPTQGFIKAYSHNGFFKNLNQVVHFYNTRNLTSQAGEVIDFTLPNPYVNLRGKPLWPTPEYPSPQTLVNPKGLRGGIGNLGLTTDEENDLVHFLQTLTDNP